MNVPKLDIDNIEGRAESESDALTKKLVGAGIPPRYYDITFNEIKRRGMPKDADWVDAYNKVHSYAYYLHKRIKDGDGLILYGSNGMLKTSLAIAVLRQYLDEGGYGRFMVMCTLAHTLRSMWSISSTEASAYHDKLVNTKLLVIDDLGAEDTQKDWVLTEIESILAERYNNKRSTIITTNLSKQELVQTYSMRIMDRLRESAACVEFKGRSLRKNPTFAEVISKVPPLQADKEVIQEKLLG